MLVYVHGNFLGLQELDCMQSAWHDNAIHDAL